MIFKRAGLTKNRSSDVMMSRDIRPRARESGSRARIVLGTDMLTYVKILVLCFTVIQRTVDLTLYGQAFPSLAPRIIFFQFYCYQFATEWLGNTKQALKILVISSGC